MTTILVGADPEVFMKNPKTGKFVSAWGTIQGTKQKPFPVHKGAVQVDGNALEFNITPAATKQEFIGNVREVYDQLSKMVPGYNLVIEPTAVFDNEYFQSLPADARELGCEPDFNAWLRDINPKPVTIDATRSAGGHVHVSWRGNDPDMPLADVDDPNHFDDCCTITKQLDYYLGVHSLAVDRDTKRRELYGKAGAFRPKPYGVEYRTLSNFWIASSELTGWVYDQVQLAMAAAFAGNLTEKLYGTYAQRIIDANDYGWRKRFRIDEIGNPPPAAEWPKKYTIMSVT